MPVDEELVRQATKRPPPIEPQKFAELMRAWRRRCKLSRVGAAYALRAGDGVENDRPSALDVGERQGAAAAAPRGAGTHSRSARGESAEAEAADHAAPVRDATQGLAPPILSDADAGVRRAGTASRTKR